MLGSGWVISQHLISFDADNNPEEGFYESHFSDEEAEALRR